MATMRALTITSRSRLTRGHSASFSMCVEEDHLSADEHPAVGYGLGDVDQCRPEIRALTGEFGEDDHDTDRGSYAWIRSLPARDVRWSVLSKRSSATTTAGARRSFGSKGQILSMAWSRTFGLRADSAKAYRFFSVAMSSART